LTGYADCTPAVVNLDRCVALLSMHVLITGFAFKLEIVPETILEKVADDFHDSLREQLLGLDVVTVQRITAFGAAAALAEFPIGEGKEQVVIIPASDALDVIGEALSGAGKVILMKVGRRLKGP